MNVSIVGTGYVGLTTGVCLAYLGHKVTCLDTDETKIQMLRAGRVPIYEPWLEELMAESEQNLRLTTSYQDAVPGADVVFIVVGTPSRPNGSPDLSYLRAAALSVGEFLSGDNFTVVVNKSTVPIGTGNWVESLVREAAHEGRFAVASNPEFLREGSALQDSLFPDRIVIGADSTQAREVLESLYRPLVEQSFAAPSFLPRPAGMGTVPLVATDLASAEMIKYAANAFLALKISYINEMAELAEKVGADIGQVAEGIGLDQRIGGRFLQAGIGWGGSCFGKDTAALVSTAAEYKLGMPIVQSAREVNYRQRERVVEKLLGELKILQGRTIGLLGLAFKPFTDDLREAPALDIARKLLSRGARVKVHDPVAMGKARESCSDLPVIYCEQPGQVAENADAVVLVTEWPQYEELPWEQMRRSMRKPILLDGRNQLDRQRMERAGFRYLTLSSGARPAIKAAAAGAIAGRDDWNGSAVWATA
jgi:UDPglucose 6-dehydrogenase